MQRGLRTLTAAVLGAGMLLGVSTTSYAAVNAAPSAVEIMPGLDSVPPIAERVKEGTREWKLEEYVEGWEKANGGRKMTDEERKILEAGCIGVTALNIDRLTFTPDLQMSFGTFDTAQNVARKLNEILAESKNDHRKFVKKVYKSKNLRGVKNIYHALPTEDVQDWSAVVFSKRFFSDQSGTSPTPHDGDPTAFLPDPKTDQVDMSAYKYLPRWPEKVEADTYSYTNFDYAWYDPATKNWWHANHSHKPVTDVNGKTTGEMKVYQSTLKHYSRPLLDFDRQIFAVTFVKKVSPNA